ncbi:PHP domain-containing protein [Planococcus donghaensis]|uniref:PHP domain-containing protein n=1 Tax=Planococcus donghaensis TaxID=414778 RepID=UPI003734DCC2
MKADLHVHSHYSDGADSVEKVIKKAKKAGVTAISFVEHDTISGWREQQRIAETHNIQAIPGIEISAYDFKRQRKVHILGYHFNSEALAINRLCKGLLELRHSHSMWQMSQIQAAGFNLDSEAVIESAKPSATVYKQHIMQQLTDAPYTSKEYQFLYKSLFKGKGVAAGDIEYASAADAVQAIVSDGGLAVMAHPGQLDSYELIPELIGAGLGGIERNHFDHSAEDHLKVEELARQYGLVMTGGSDYHGAFGAMIEPGDIVSPGDVNSVKRL